MSEEPNSPTLINPEKPASETPGAIDAFKQAFDRQNEQIQETLTGEVTSAASSEDVYDETESELAGITFASSPGASSARSSPVRKPKGFFWTGPNRYLRNCRPYHWLSIEANDLEKPGQPRSYIEALDLVVAEAVKQSKEKGKPFTDVFILSHGWHRNLYSAASAYDRLVARFTMLSHSKRLYPRDSFNPLFICLHWHSDPGENQWMDGAGRRSKLSFIEKVRDHFHVDPGINLTLAQCEAMYLQDFEVLFEIMSRLVSTPEGTAKNVNYNEMQSAHRLLNRYRLVGSDSASCTTIAEKTTVLWTCYHESQPRRRLAVQKDQTKYGHLSWIQSAVGLLSFIAALVPLIALLPALFNFLKGLPVTVLQHLVSYVPARIISVLLWEWPYPQLLILLVVSVLYLFLAALWTDFINTKNGQQNPNKGVAHARGFSFILVIAYAICQIVFALPFLTSCFFTYFFGGIRAKSLWEKELEASGDERIGKRNQPVTDQDIEDYREAHKTKISRGRFAHFARRPVHWLRKAVAPDSKLIDLTKTLDSQLAFYEMQNRGVQCGYLAGEAVTKLGRDGRAKGIFTTDTNFHFIGHSFGALVVANAVRTITQLDANRDVRIKSVCFLQAALSSTWFDNEEAVLQRVEGNIANVYSKYDTATGFYYPLASFARTAAGNMGFMDARTIDRTIQPATKPETALVLLVKPPSLKLASEPVPNAGMAKILNLDASRIIYDGPIAMGGAHNDIFKDDVVHLIWAACEL